MHQNFLKSTKVQSIISFSVASIKMNQSGFNPSYIGSRSDILNLVPPDCQKILDIGCSIGTLGAQIKDSLSDAEVIGIELDKEMAEKAIEKLDKVIVGNIEDMVLTDHLKQNYFDCIIFGDVLEHLIDPWTVLRELTLYLKPDGTVIASMPNVRHYSSICSLLFKGYWPYRDRGIHDRTHLRFFTKKNILELFHRSDLQINKIIPHYRIFENPFNLNRFFRKLNLYSQYFAIPLLRNFLAFQYLIVATYKKT